MNIIDLAILFIIAMSAIIGVYNGFLVSALNAASFLLSWLGALVFYPLLTKILLAKFPNLFQAIVYYADGSSKIPAIEDRTTSITRFSADQLSRLFDEIHLPNPFDKVLSSSVFHQTGLTTLGDFFDYTVASIIINILSILLLFLILKLVFTIAISVGKVVVSLPVLKQFDSLFGAGFGVLRGLFVVYFLFAIIPIAMTLAPVDIFSEYLEGSLLADIFFRGNIFTSFIRGKV